jgi:hypothetical protein
MALYQRTPGKALGARIVEAFLDPGPGRRLIHEAGGVPEK